MKFGISVKDYLLHLHSPSYNLDEFERVENTFSDVWTRPTDLLYKHKTSNKYYQLDMFPSTISFYECVRINAFLSKEFPFHMNDIVHSQELTYNYNKRKDTETDAYSHIGYETKDKSVKLKCTISDNTNNNYEFDYDTDL